MTRQREIMIGRRDQFAVKVAFLPDPDNGRGASREYSVSWGSLEIWVNGHNICRHIEQNEPVDSVHWYLLPVLQWLARNWDFLLHEERLPGKNASRDAWISMQKTADAPPGLSEDAAEMWEARWHDWWGRHCLLACREGGLLPNLFIRRWRDLIELSWGDRTLAGAPDHFRFDAFHGCARLAPDEVAYVLFDVLSDASQHLREEYPESTIIKRLVEDVAQLEATDHRRRLGLLSGYRSDSGDAADRWTQVESLFPQNLSKDVSDTLFGTRESKLVIQGSCQAALMFGSLAPSISDSDAQTLAARLVDCLDPGGESSTLRQLVRNEPLERTDDEAWTQGYQLADDLHEALHLSFAAGPSVDIDSVYSHLGISVDRISLQDASVRAVAIAGEHHKPAVLINTQYEYRDSEPRRFTLGHELCHVLHDRSYGAQLAMASGPWAPVGVEQRANAFAANFLMPRELIEAIIRQLTISLDSSQAVWEVASVLKTSFSATLAHLCNLGFIDDVTRDALRQEMEERAAQRRSTSG